LGATAAAASQRLQVRLAMSRIFRTAKMNGIFWTRGFYNGRYIDGFGNGS
jgi:hypothetical protein